MPTQPPEMVERVARAIEGVHDLPPGVAERFARAAIQAMREPTEDVVIAGCTALAAIRAELIAVEISGNNNSIARLKMRTRWRAMIDKALEP